MMILFGLQYKQLYIYIEFNLETEEYGKNNFNTRTKSIVDNEDNRRDQRTIQGKWPHIYFLGQLDAYCIWEPAYTFTNGII
jgi:hypothetical protein